MTARLAELAYQTLAGFRPEKRIELGLDVLYAAADDESNAHQLADSAQNRVPSDALELLIAHSKGSIKKALQELRKRRDAEVEAVLTPTTRADNSSLTLIYDSAKASMEHGSTLSTQYVAAWLVVALVEEVREYREFRPPSPKRIPHVSERVADCDCEGCKSI